MSNFKVGDVVRRKAGGPKMTVDRIEPNGTAFCQWFVGATLNSGTFSPELLERTFPLERMRPGVA